MGRAAAQGAGLNRAARWRKVLPLPGRHPAMQQVRIQITGPGGGPGRPPGLLARVLISIAALVALVVAAFLGAFFFLAALGFFFVASVVVAIRLWWARRQIARAMRGGRRPGEDGPGPRGRPDVIEGEYLVVDEERRRGDEADRTRGGER
jgi:hypothetical protein